MNSKVTAASIILVIGIIGGIFFIQTYLEAPKETQINKKPLLEELPLTTSTKPNDGLTLDKDVVIYQDDGNLYSYNMTTGRVSMITNNEKRNIIRGVNSKNYLIESTNKTGNYHPGSVYLYEKKTQSSKLLLEPLGNLFSREVMLSETHVAWIDSDKINVYEISTGNTISIRPDAEWIQNPGLSGNYLYIQAYDGHDTEFIVFKLEDLTQIFRTNNSFADRDMTISPGQFAWFQGSSLVLHNITTAEEKVIPLASPNSSHLQVEGNFAVLESEGKIYLYNKSSGQTLRLISDSEMESHNPVFMGSTILWQDHYQVWGSEIVSYNISSGEKKLITNTIGGSYIEHASGDIVAIYQYGTGSSYKLLFLNTLTITPLYSSDASAALDTADGYIREILGDEYFSKYFTKATHYYLTTTFSSIWRHRIQYIYETTVGSNTSFQNVLIYLDSNLKVVKNDGLPNFDDRQPYAISLKNATQIALNNITITDKIDRIEQHLTYITQTRDKQVNRYAWVISIYTQPRQDAWYQYQVFIDPINGKVIDVEGIGAYPVF